MKIAALAPQFVVEAPDEADGVEGDDVVEDLHHLRVVEASSVGESTGGSPPRSQLDDETRQGLKRLSELIRKQGRERSSHQHDQPHAPQHEHKHGNGHGHGRKVIENPVAFERRCRKAHIAYVNVAQPLLEPEVKGRWMNLFA